MARFLLLIINVKTFQLKGRDLNPMLLVAAARQNIVDPTDIIQRINF